MNRLTPEQRLQIVQFYFENNGSVRNTYRALRPFYPRQIRPSEQLIRLTMKRFHTTFTLIDNSHPQRRRTVRTEEAIATICQNRSIETRYIYARIPLRTGTPGEWSSQSSQFEFEG
ncbi:hypothetical protein ACJJTC_017318 [Scirpophaga incertulas]